jgi:hypothetical protein
MAEQKPIQFDGTLPTTIGNVYTPEFGFKAVFTNIRFNNKADSAYTIWLFFKINNNAAPFLLYKFELDAGDVVNDDTVYELPFGAYLVGLSSIDTVQYVISGFLEKVVST